jgi:Zn-dependent metalloprotease
MCYGDGDGRIFIRFTKVETSTESAATLYGNNSREHKAVTKAWKSVEF